MEDNVKLSIAMELIDKEIANLNIQLSENSESILKDKLNYLLMLKDSIYSGGFDGIDEFLEKYTEVSNTKSIECKVMAVPDNIKCTGIDNIIFRSRAGEAEEAWRYEFIGEEIIDDVENKKINSDIIITTRHPHNKLSGKYGKKNIIKQSARKSAGRCWMKGLRKVSRRKS